MWEKGGGKSSILNASSAPFKRDSLTFIYLDKLVLKSRFYYSRIILIIANAFAWITFKCLRWRSAKRISRRKLNIAIKIWGNFRRREKRKFKFHVWRFIVSKSNKVKKLHLYMQVREDSTIEPTKRQFCLSILEQNSSEATELKLWTEILFFY